MSRAARLACGLVLFACWLAGCGVAKDGPLIEFAESFVPSDASEKRVTSELPRVQIAFEVKRPWLQFAFEDRRIEQAKVDGWEICGPETPEWESYEDSSAAPAIYRRQRVYVLFRDGVLVELFGIYNNTVDSIAGANGAKNPSVQQGVVAVSKATADQAKQIANVFHLSCDTHEDQR